MERWLLIGVWLTVSGLHKFEQKSSRGREIAWFLSTTCGVFRKSLHLLGMNER